MKLVLWVVTIIGLAPVLLLSLLHILAHVQMARNQPTPDEMERDGVTLTFTESVTFQLKGFAPVPVAKTAWPAVCVLLGAAILVLGLIFLLPKPNVPDKGTVADIQTVAGKLRRSDPPVSVVITQPADDAGLVLSKEEQSVELTFYLSAKDPEARIRSHLAEQGIEPTDDFLGNEGTEGEFRILTYPLEGSDAEISQLCVSIFREAYGVDEGHTLHFQWIR